MEKAKKLNQNKLDTIKEDEEGEDESENVSEEA